MALRWCARLAVSQTGPIRRRIRRRMSTAPPPPRQTATHYTYNRATGKPGKATYFVSRSPRWSWRELVAWGTVAVAAGGTAVYVGSQTDEVPITHRKRTMLLAKDHDIAIGGALVSTLNHEKLLPENNKVVKLVVKVAQPLIATVESMGIHCDWEFFVVQDDMVNALCAPNGKIIIYTGILKKIAEWVDEGELPSMDAGIAAVLAHEIAHAVARHVAEELSRNPLVALPAAVISHESPLLASLLQWGISLGFTLPASRAMEHEADLIGMILLARSCYDPRFMGKIFRLLDSLQSHATFKYLSTHPLGEERFAACNANVPIAMEELCKACVVQNDGKLRTNYRKR